MRLNEYTFIPTVFVELKPYKPFFVGTGFSFPFTMLHYTRILLLQNNLIFDKLVQVAPLTSYHKFGVNIPVYAGVNIGKKLALSLRVDKGLSNHKKTDMPSFRQYI